MAAVKMESFSIREYASRMRSVDVVKCWPFGEVSSEEKMKEILPVITVKKFTWWLDELERINNFGKDDEDENLASIRRKSRLLKSKGKAPKKRSIVELFAVAPEVERPITSSEDDDNNKDDNEDENGFGKMKSFGNINHSKLKAFNKKKEKICKFKSIHNSTPNPYGVDNTLIHSKKTKVKKNLVADAKAKARRTSKLMLEGLTKARLSENKISLLKIQNLNKKYALSIKDDVREGSRPHMESDFLKHSNFRHADNDIEKSLSIQEMEEIDKETYKWRGNHINMQTPFDCVRYHGNEVPCRSKLLNRSMPSLHNDNLVRNGEYDRREEHDAPLLYPRSTGTSLLHVSEDVDARASSSSRSVDYFKPYPQSFHSYSSTPNSSSVNSNQFPLKKFGEDYNELTLQRRPLMSPKELMRTVCFIPDQRSTMQMYGERSISDDLFGLPLNSQGELIRYGGMYQRGGGPNIPSESGIGSFGARQDDRYTAFPKSDITQHSCSSMQLSPSTMRLMGQEFRVDGRGFRRPENRELFKDKEIIEDQQVDNTEVYGSSFKSRFLSESVIGGPKGIRMHSSEEYNGTRTSSGNPLYTTAPKSTTFPLFDDQKGTHDFNKGKSPHDSYPYADFVSRGHIILPENLSGYRPQSLIPAMVFHDTCRNTSKSRLQPAKHMQMTTPFPIRPLSLERSSEVVPPGCFQAFGCSDNCVHPPLTTPMVYQRTTKPSKSIPHHGSQNTLASASSMIRHPVLPVHSSFQYDDHVEKLKYQNRGNTTKKRVASTISNQYIKSSKMPRSSQEDFTTSAAPVKVVNYTRQNLNWDIEHHGLGSDSASGKYKPHTVGYGDKNEMNPRMRHYRSSGPVKPVAGAKHVLKPYQRNEPSILTTPFAANQPAGVIAQIRKP